MPLPKKRGERKRQHTALERRMMAAHNARTLEEAVERAVQHLLDEYTIPVQLGPLAQKLNARIVALPPDVALGETHRLADRNQIKIRAEDQGQQRQRFTLAHEYAHIILDSLGKRVPASAALEQLCDRLAAAILMPLREVTAFIRHSTPQEVLAIAKAFDVSLQAAAVRFATITGCALFRVSLPPSPRPQASLPFSAPKTEAPVVTRLAGPLGLTTYLKRAILDQAPLYQEQVRDTPVRDWLLSSATAHRGDRVVLLKPRF